MVDDEESVAIADSHYRHLLPPLGLSGSVAEPHLLVGSRPFTVQAFGLAQWASYAYPGGIGPGIGPVPE